MVVIREEEKTQRTKKQPSLFELRGFIVTNIEFMLPEEIWRFYKGILSYSLDVNISHYYGANVAHFHLVMLAYNLMNLFKELVLGQRDKKRMGKWIRQRFLLIAGRLISSGRKFILKLQEDWAYKEKYKEAEGRLKRLAWVI